MTRITDLEATIREALLQYDDDFSREACEAAEPALAELVALLVAAEARAVRAEAERDELKALIGPECHVFESRDDGGWSLKHPLACRDEMLDCPIHQECSKFYEAPVEAGRWRIELEASGGVSFAALVLAGQEGKPVSPSPEETGG